MKVIVILPARYGSTRFPGKPLAKICGKPMIQYVYETASSAAGIDDCFVATDDQRIVDAVVSFGGKAILTGDFSCGSDRVEWASRKIDCDVIINVQGDEPLIKKEMIEELVSAFKDPNVQMATLKKRIDNLDDINNPNVVKVITDVNGDAIYFSRFSIPFCRDDKNKGKLSVYKHVGIYAYRKQFLSRYVKLEKSFLEQMESLEQLRVLENGFKIRVLETNCETIGVDTPEQLKEIEVLLNAKQQ